MFLLLNKGGLYPFGAGEGDYRGAKTDDHCDKVYYHDIMMFGNSFSRLYVSIYNVMMYITIILLCLVTLSIAYM